jgi:hypothetical protein
MSNRILADGVVVAHLGFIVFVLLGGFLAWRRPAWAWLHLPAVAWGVYAEANGSICPLTPLENLLRLRAGREGYTGSFVDHYLVPLIYPADLTADHQRALAAMVVAVNVLAYGGLWWRRRRKRPPPTHMT